MITKFKIYEKSNLKVGDYAKIVIYNKDFELPKKETLIGEITLIYKGGFRAQYEQAEFIPKYYYINNNFNNMKKIEDVGLVAVTQVRLISSLKPLNKTEKMIIDLLFHPDTEKYNL